MPALNFKEAFADAVLAGLKVRAQGRERYPTEHVKLQTIRARSKRIFRIGDELTFYTGQRTSSCKKLGSARCLDVTPIQICSQQGEVQMPICGIWLNLSEAEICALAIADGFKDATAFFRFFNDTTAERFSGYLIKW